MKPQCVQETKTTYNTLPQRRSPQEHICFFLRKAWLCRTLWGDDASFLFTPPTANQFDRGWLKKKTALKHITINNSLLQFFTEGLMSCFLIFNMVRFDMQTFQINNQWFIHPKMKTLSSISHPHASQTLDIFFHLIHEHIRYGKWKIKRAWLMCENQQGLFSHDTQAHLSFHNNQ